MGLNLGKGNEGVTPLGKEGNDDKFTASRQNVATDNADAQKSPEQVFQNPPTPAVSNEKVQEEKAAGKGLMEGEVESEKGPQDKVEVFATPTVAEYKYTSTPIQRYKLGRFRFENAVLTLTDPKDVAEFKKLLGELPPQEQHRIKELSLSAAEEIVRQYQKNQARASKAIGSETGDRQPQNQTGSGKLEDSNPKS